MPEGSGNELTSSSAWADSHALLFSCAAACAIIATAILGGFWMAGKPEGTLSTAALLADLKELRAHVLAPLVTVPLFLAGSLVLAPLYGMIALCALLFDPLTASLGALGGTMIATATTHWLGGHFGRAFGHRVPTRISIRTREMAR